MVLLSGEPQALKRASSGRLRAGGKFFFQEHQSHRHVVIDVAENAPICKVCGSNDEHATDLCILSFYAFIVKNGYYVIK